MAWTLVAAASLGGGPALAHPGHGGAEIAAGLIHPLTGADHLLAMLAVGLWASRRGGRALLLWPLCFVAAMLFGYRLGMTSSPVTIVEPMVLASVIVLGAMVASSSRTPLVLGAGILAVFGAAHGYAHGAEAPQGAGLRFALGFALSSAGLHALGAVVGLSALRASTPRLLSWMGGGVAASGLILAIAG